MILQSTIVTTSLVCLQRYSEFILLSSKALALSISWSWKTHFNWKTLMNLRIYLTWRAHGSTEGPRETSNLPIRLKILTLSSVQSTIVRKRVRLLSGSTISTDWNWYLASEKIAHSSEKSAWWTTVSCCQLRSRKVESDRVKESQEEWQDCSKLLFRTTRSRTLDWAWKECRRARHPETFSCNSISTDRTTATVYTTWQSSITYKHGH